MKPIPGVIEHPSMENSEVSMSCSDESILEYDADNELSNINDNYEKSIIIEN
jgi:hypothetical protein